MTNKLHGRLQIIIFLLIAILFCYFRLKPILLQSVGYTYDQGRDFLKAAEIVLYKNPTFIGPTTGIGGVFHGAWWYYILAIAFMIFGGLPIGFYLFIVMIQTMSAVLLGYLLYRRFGFLTSALTMGLVATSGHFIFTSIFIGNNVLAVPSVMLTACAILLFFEKKYTIRIPWSKIMLPTSFLMGLGLGLISEFEFAFGLMVIPSFLASLTIVIALQLIRNQAGTISFLKSEKCLKYIALFLTGLFIPFIPRLLFELKNGFQQTQVLMNFFLHPAYHTPRPFADVYRERLQLFSAYYESIFMSDIIRWTVSAIVAVSVSIRLFKRHFSVNPALLMLILLFIFLFGFSLFYRDTFWSYYYDGIQVIILAIGAYLLSYHNNQARMMRWLQGGTLILILTTGYTHLIKDMSSQPVYDGIQVQRDIVRYIHALEQPNTDYCVQIYTPPVIPYTYQYLFLYYERSTGISQPKDTWVKKQCWFILEHDDNNERKDEWITNHIPEKARRLSQKKIKDVSIELWKR